MRWTVIVADILKEPADVLVCSANPYLNLSGGVGGAIMQRCGDAMQGELHKYLSDHGLKCVPPTTVVSTLSYGLPVSAVLHAVALDPFYSSKPEWIQSTVTTALSIAASRNAKRVTLTALATGYGRLSMREFAQAITPVVSLDFPPVKEVVICVRRDEQREELSRILGAQGT